MKITFLTDHQSAASGNEFYTAGAQADLPRGNELVAEGVARAGWEAAQPEEPEAEETPEPVKAEKPARKTTRKRK